LTTPVNIEGTVKGTGRDNVGGVINFVEASENDRGTLLEAGGIVYVPFASINDAPIFHGWIFGYNASTIVKTSTFNSTPNDSSNHNGDGEDGGIWNGALAADTNNNIFTATGNGTWDNSVRDWGNTYLMKPGTTLTLQVFGHSHPRVGTTARTGVGQYCRVFQGTTTTEES
jgi:hypothetical protein